MSFSTDRLVLRRLEESDMDSLLKLYSDPITSLTYMGELAFRGEKFQDTVRMLSFSIHRGIYEYMAPFVRLKRLRKRPSFTE